MTRHELFATWAPGNSIWSDWAKPIVFAHATGAPPSGPPVELPDVPLALADGRMALVLDLPGPLGVRLGPALARCGYRPVPLYNAAPGGPADGPEAVLVQKILVALVECGPALAGVNPGLAGDAPPAFLLDADRRHAAVPLGPGVFDNRSVSLPTDFPSAALLASRGITAVLLIRPGGAAPQADLAHTLRRYQEAGLAILGLGLDDPAGGPQLLVVPRPGGFGSIFQRFLAGVGLRRHPLGGFGGMLGEPSGG